VYYVLILVNAKLALIIYKGSSEGHVRLECVHLQNIQTSVIPTSQLSTHSTHIPSNTKTPSLKLRMKIATTLLLFVLAALTTGVIAAPVALTESLDAIGMRGPHEDAPTLEERKRSDECPPGKKRSPWGDDWGC